VIGLALSVALLGAPICERAQPLDAGRLSPCDGVLVTAEQVRSAIICREELRLRRSSVCPSVALEPSGDAWWPLIASALSGLALGLASALLIL